MTLQTHTTVISWLQDDGRTGAKRWGPCGPFTRAAQTPPTQAARCWRGLEGDAFRSHRKPQGVKQTKKVFTGFVMQPLKSNLRTSRGEQTLLSTDCANFPSEKREHEAPLSFMNGPQTRGYGGRAEPARLRHGILRTRRSPRQSGVLCPRHLLLT